MLKMGMLKIPADQLTKLTFPHQGPKNLNNLFIELFYHLRHFSSNPKSPETNLCFRPDFKFNENFPNFY